MLVKNDIRTITGYNQVEDIEINYSILQETSEPAESVSASFERNGHRMGNINAYRDGRLYISLDQSNSLPLTTRLNILTTVLTDIDDKFNEQVK